MKSDIGGNFLRQARLFGIGTSGGTQTGNIEKLASATNISIPSAPNIDVISKAPGVPSMKQTIAGASVEQTPRIGSRGPRSQGVKPANIEGFDKLGEGIGKALKNSFSNNPFDIDPSDTPASLHGFKEGGFVTRKKNK